MESFALLKTNVGLTTNVKIVVTSNYDLFLDSIVSTSELSESRYKRFRFNKNQFFDDILPSYYKDTPIDIAYKIKFDDDADIMSGDFANQYDDIYQYGARNIIDNKFYTEEFEYFAPLHINNKKIPSKFIIFRVDGPGLQTITKDNFRDEILQKMKSVKVFDLTLESSLGEWIDKNFISNRYYPNKSLYIDFRKMEFSTWKGIDFERGGYTEKSFMMDSVLEYEQPYFDMEKLILNGYQNNKVIYPNLLNMSFLFDDTPATKTSLRKWSLNRYLGFYLDELTLVDNITPNFLPKLRTDVLIDENNVIYSPSNDSPFLEDWRVNDYPYLEIGGIFYKIQKFQESTDLLIQKIKNTDATYEEKLDVKFVVKYKVISEIDLSSYKYVDINKNLIKIDANNRLLYQNGDKFIIPSFEDADVWLIEIGDKFHNIILVDGFLTLHTDFGFRQSEERFEYYINDPNTNFKTSLDLVTNRNNAPIEFKIFKCKFTNIKQFDTDIVDTEYSKYEYIRNVKPTNTDEPKMYVEDLESTSRPRDLVEFKLQDNLINIPVSSEYTANSETFRLIQNNLSPLWRKNEERLKWGYIGSLSSNDYPYLLNNTFLSEDYNRTCDTKSTNLSRTKRNLDYFYTINSDNDDYSFHSLHIENYVNGIKDLNFDFKIEHYLGLTYSYDYFEHFFGKKIFFDSATINRQSKKYSFFIEGDKTTPNVTLFKGLRFKISEVDNINIDEDKIQRINFKNTNKFENWKFSILLSQNEYLILQRDPTSNDASLAKSKNVLQWRIIDDWKMEKDYDADSLVLFNNTLYQSVTQSRITNPSINPSISNQWTLYTQSSIFYSPLFSGLTNSNNMDNFNLKYPPLVFSDGDYYYSDGESNIDFWRTNKTYQSLGNQTFGYRVDEKVFYKNKVWKSLWDENRSVPSDNSGFYQDSIFYNYWEVSTDIPRWTKVELWNSEKDYFEEFSWDANLFTFGNYVLWNDVVYATTSDPPPGVPPNLDDRWVRVYSMVPDTTYLYSTDISKNNIISLNGKYYQCLSNSSSTGYDSSIFYNFTLDNGIYIIINEKYKNILVNIYVNDNTYSESKLFGNIYQISNTMLKGTNRDNIYQSIFGKLSTNNFMNCLNDLSNNFGFSDKVKYVIVDENGKLKIYDFNNLDTISDLPYILTCLPPDEFYVRNRSNILTPLTLKPSELKPKRILNDSNIENIGQLNWYNGMHLATSIEKNIQKNVFLPNYSGLVNDNFFKVYRHSGYYEPITRNIELFDSPQFFHSQTNYKFDTDLTNFGLMRQRVVSKVNRRGNLLKLRNNSKLKSIYPMVDEFGYHLIDFFIFKSSWDFEYHVETIEPEVEESTLVTKVDTIDVNDKTFRNNNSNLL